jgi:isoquinoline 1-oxidoreductase
MTVHTGTQRPFAVKQEIVDALGLAPAQVRVIVPDTGSGYGGKHSGDAAVEAAKIAKVVGKPVKVVWSRVEEFTWAYFRPAGVVEISAGVSPDGLLLGWQHDIFNAGRPGIETPYQVADPKATAHDSVPPLRQGSYRALAATFNNFARETAMDELAHLAGIDPLQFRIKNLQSDRLRAVLAAAAERFGWGKEPSTATRGFGIACGTEKGGNIATAAEIAVDPASGTIRVVRVVSAFECGAILNPDHLLNQVNGAMIMGLGGALFEAIHFKDGKIQNAHLSRYRVPRYSDIPVIDTVLLDRRDLVSAGAGECPIIGIAPAIGNAIFAATGDRRRSMPLLGA